MRLSALFAFIVSLIIALFAYCSIQHIPPLNRQSDNESEIALDANSRVTNAVTISGTAGEILTIDSGTVILRQNADGTWGPLPSEARLTVALSNRSEQTALPSQAIRIASFAITASINGEDAELLFVSDSTLPSSPMPNTGASVKINLSEMNIDDGSELKLYKVSNASTMEYVGSWIVNVPSIALSKSKSVSGSQDAFLNPDGTGEYEFFYEPILNSTSATMPTSGVYWNTYSNIPDTSYNIGEVVFDGPCFAGYVHLTEPSTGEILAMASFAADVNCVTFTSSTDGVQYWVERIQAPNGGTSAIKIASTAANIPWLTLYMYSVKSGRCYYRVYNLRPDGGVHTPEGAVLDNPYEDPELKFGGDKVLLFKGDYKQGTDIKYKVQNAGYQIFSYRFYNNLTEFSVGYTSTGRAYIQENVLKKENWFPVETNGNKGIYELKDTVTINIESHDNEQTVSNQNVTVKGTISNPYVDRSISNMLVQCTNGLENREVHATIENDSTFTFDVDLFNGLNVFTFRLKWKTENGKEENVPKYEIRAKGNKITAFVLNHESTWIGLLDFTRTTTIRTHEPDTSECVSTEKITANLKMSFNGKLWYIKQSHENAVTCSEFDNCYLFSGKNSGAVTVSLSSECKERNCEGKLPLIPISKRQGQASLPEYSLSIAVSLSPWKEGDNSTDRRYHLKMHGGASLSVHTDPNWPKGENQIYDCLTKEWNKSSFNIDAYIFIDDPDLFSFPSTSELEEFTEYPTSAKNWSFSKKTVSEDGLTTTEYSATLTVQPQ